jgi:RNA polymerase sigma-70 factor (ECF subfamily)
MNGNCLPCPVLYPGKLRLITKTATDTGRKERNVDKIKMKPNPDADGRNARSVELMAKTAGGDMNAFQELVEMHQSSVIGTVAKMLGNANDAHDISQQVFVRVWKASGNYQPTAKFTTWLFTITRNLVFNESRKRQRRSEVSIDEREDDHHMEERDHTTASPEENLLTNELEEAITAAIDALPENQRMAVVLRRFEDLPYEEIGEVLEISVSAVKSLLFRARTQLKESLQEYMSAVS